MFSGDGIESGPTQHDNGSGNKADEGIAKADWINLREEAMLIPPFDECPTHNHIFIMNVIIWNCKGDLKLTFQNHVRELVRNYNPTMLVVMETQTGGERAKEITNRLPFENAIHTDTIGYAGCLWML